MSAWRRHIHARGPNIANNHTGPVKSPTVAARIYFAIAFPLTRAVSIIERRVRSSPARHPTGP
jgi:ABC-type amino acid transport system permease subunit